MSCSKRPPAPGGTQPLAEIVRGEAIRADAEARIRPDPVRLAVGWERRFVIETARAGDLVRLYEDTGHEVAVDPVPADALAEQCDGCRIVFMREYVSIYTRRRPTAAP